MAKDLIHNFKVLIVSKLIYTVEEYFQFQCLYKWKITNASVRS